MQVRVTWAVHVVESLVELMLEFPLLVVITSAGKPNFYTEQSRPFREVNTETGRIKFNRVSVWNDHGMALLERSSHAFESCCCT